MGGLICLRGSVRAPPTGLRLVVVVVISWLHVGGLIRLRGSVRVPPTGLRLFFVWELICLRGSERAQPTGLMFVLGWRGLMVGVLVLPIVCFRVCA